MTDGQREAIHALARAGLHTPAEVAAAEYAGDGVWSE